MSQFWGVGSTTYDLGSTPWLTEKPFGLGAHGTWRVSERSTEGISLPLYVSIDEDRLNIQQED